MALRYRAWKATPFLRRVGEPTPRLAARRSCLVGFRPACIERKMGERFDYLGTRQAAFRAASQVRIEEIVVAHRRERRYSEAPDCWSRRPKTSGWGARIRTQEWRYQKPLPYHLATPQQREAE